MYKPQTQQKVIGTAWRGHHVVLIRCNSYTDQLLAIKHTTMISPSDIQYVLVKT